MRPAPNPRVAAFLRERGDLWLSVVVLYELEYGVELIPRGKRQAEISSMIAEIVANYGDRILPVGCEAARRAARLRARARRAGRPAQIADALIAGTAEAHVLVVATRNHADFAPFDIDVTNPWDARSG